ncbi:MAG: sugar transferase [Propionibacteriales bacterium]|nr:sugar transferase [Propionibacteriales bacterium]
MTTSDLVSGGTNLKVGSGSHLGAQSLRAPGGKTGRRLGRLGIDVIPLAVIIDLVALTVAQLVVSLSVRSTLLMGVLVLALNAVGGHYKARVAPSILDELPSLTARALVAGAITTSLWLFVPDIPAKQAPVYGAMVFLVIATLGRSFGYPLVRHYRKVAETGRATMIIGCGHVGNQLAARLLEHPEYGLTPIGFVDDQPLIPPPDRHIPLLGGTDSLTRLLVEHRIHNVIVAFMSSRESVMVDMLRTCDRLSCEIFFVPRLYELHASGPDTELVWGIPLTRLSRASYRTLTWRSKRVFDFVLAGLGLLVLSPLFAVCALAVRIEGGKGVIFKQERVGVDGQRFTILKFRSLTPVDEVESAQRWSITGDPRLGPVGKILRNLSLDELPQLWNVVRGDMSLVGPRPERPAFVEEFAERFPRYVARHRVPAGLTGWAQVNGLRGDTDIADRANFDNYYIENWSLWVDVKILLRTVAQVVGRRDS